MTPPIEPVLHKMKGPIGESTLLFTMQLPNAGDLVLDMSEVTYINSIGVKHWIIWTMRIPRTCMVRIKNAPFVIVNQANTVMGFLTPKIRIESFKMPYACETCNFEDIRLLEVDKDYFYAAPGTPRRLNVPSPLACPKCGKETFEPDVFLEKSFAFLG